MNRQEFAYRAPHLFQDAFTVMGLQPVCHAKVDFILMDLPHVLFVHLKWWGAYFVTQIQYVLNVKVGIILTQVHSNA